MIMSPVVAAGMTSADPTCLGEILRAVRSHLGLEVGFISEFHEGRRVFRYVESAEGKQCIEIGGSDPLEESYCHWISQGRLPRLIRDPKDHPFTANLAVTEQLPVGAHLSVPIVLRDGRVYGTFCCFSFAPDRSMTDRDLATMEAFAQVASEQIQRTVDVERIREVKQERVQTALRDCDVKMVYQPAIRTGGQVAFMEALARFHISPYQSPDRWFAMAHEVGLGQELELFAIKAALNEGLSQLPQPLSISVNVSPDVIISSSFSEIMTAVPVSRVIVEITEHEAVTHYSALMKALEPLRAAGLRVAIDDMGAGYSSLRHILHLKPDIIKMDMSLSRGIDTDPTRRALASALVSFSRDIGSELVAEGVETPSEMRTLEGLGVDLAQGYLFGKPSTLADQPTLRYPALGCQTP